MRKAKSAEVLQASVRRKLIEPIQTKRKSGNTIKANVKRIMQPNISDYKIGAEILQGAIKRKIVQPVYNNLLQSKRRNMSIEELKELAKPYLVKNLRDAWKSDIYKLTLYKKPLNKLNKAELYHELLNVNHDFSNIPKRQPRARR